MKRKTLHKKNANSIFTLLLVFLFGLLPFFVQAQPQKYESVKGALVGTSDTRLMSSIYETDTTVTMLIRAVGFMRADNIAFSVFYDPGKLVFCKENLEPITLFGPLQSGAAVLAPEFVNKQWMFDGLHKAAGTTTMLTDYVSGHETMNAILFEVGLPIVTPGNLFVVDTGEVKPVMQFTFKKLTNQKLAESDFGLGVKTTGTTTGFYQPEFGHDGLFIWYRERNTSSNTEVDPNIFLFRSGLIVETYLATPPATTSATINGTFWQGAVTLPVSNNILDNIGTATTGSAKLRHDAVTKYGFIYTTANVNMSIDDFSGLIKIDNVNYPVPTTADFTNGYFERNGNTFYIIMVGDNTGSLETLPYETTISNLTPNQNYYAWAYTHYYFETSNSFQAVGNRIEIHTSDCVALNIGSLYTVEEPRCGNNNGKIQMNVTGGSGNYVFSVNGGAFTAYSNDIITNLTAGTYTIAVKDIIQPSCDSTVVHNIVLHSTNTDLIVVMTATNAETCTGDGSLFVVVTGGTGNYSYSLNGSVPTIENGWITDLSVGEYELIVTDNGCTATSGKVYIYADDSQLAADVNITTHATCSANTGTVEFTVTDAIDNTFTYQLDGYTAKFVEDYNNTPITLSNLSAGIHYLRITDACKEIVKEIIITNGSSNPFAFTAASHPELLSCDSTLIPGSITLTLSGNSIPDYEYCIDGSTWKPFTVNGNTAVIPNLHAGFYRVQVKDGSGCTYEVNNVTIERKTSFDSNLTAPVATSPQTFCSSATVANLQATGANIKWYLTATGGFPLSPTTVLLHDAIYYAVQSFGFCESRTRTAVKVYIDPFAVLDTPQIATPQNFCGLTVTLADIATDGNTNIVWYATADSDEKLLLTTSLENNTTYYAALEAGNCLASPRLAVLVFIDKEAPSAPEVEPHQHFCDGAVIANIAVPNNKIVWYLAATGGEPLAATYPLQDGAIYHAALVAGDCESTTRKPVTIHLDAPDAPEAPEVQPVCKKQTLADLVIIGGGIVWYDAETGGKQLQLKDTLVVGKTYWAAQSSGNCEGERIGITITDACYVVYGTVFPFVHWGTDVDTLFKVTVSLYNVPTTTGDPVDAILSSTSVQSVTATFYDGTTYIPGTPKYPGAMGSANNPGKKISWEKIGKTVVNVNDTPVAPGEEPESAVGMYTFTNIVPGTYILEVYRPGFLTRWGVVTINEDGMSLGHREIIAGEFNDDFSIRLNDISILNGNFAEKNSAGYKAKYDVNGSLDVDASDVEILLFNLGAFLNIYLETEEWINGN